MKQTLGQNAGRDMSMTSMLLFALPVMATQMLITPVNSVIPGVYVKYTSVSLGAMATILVVSRLFDAVSDPIIGALSDRTRSPLGRRRPWIVAGTVLATLGAWLVFTPNASTGAVYFLFVYLLMVLGWTMIIIPYRAWGMETIRGYHGRTLLSTFFELMAAFGAIVFMAVPLMPFLETSEFNFESLRWMGILIVFFLPATIVILLLTHKEGPSLSSKQVSVIQALRTAWQSKLLLRLSGAYLFSGMGSGALLAVAFIFVDSYLKIGSWFSILWIVSTVANVLAIPLTVQVIRRMEKHIAWAGSSCLTGLCCASMALLPQGEAAVIPALFLFIIYGVVEMPYKIVPLPLLADVSDHIQLKTGVDEKASHIALMTLIGKSNLALGGGLAFGILQFFDYQVGGTNEAVADFGLLLALSAVPFVFYVGASTLLWRFPLDKRRHDIVRRRLERRSL